MKIWLGRKKKSKVVDERKLAETIKRELNIYVTRDELREYLANIERDERKKKLWDSLSANKKIKVLRFVLEKKGEQHAKK